MPRFEIKGKGRDSGRSRKRTYTADTASQARALAEADGTAVESVTRLPAGPAAKGAPAKQSTSGAKETTTKTTAKTGATQPPKAPVKATPSGVTKASQPQAAEGPKSEPTEPPASAPAGGKAPAATARDTEVHAATAPAEAKSAGSSPTAAQPEPSASAEPAPASRPMSPSHGLRSGKGAGTGCLPVLVAAIGIGLVGTLLLL